MARIIANGVGNGKGRTGSNYYRHTRGRTIMAQLPGPNDDRKAKAKTNPNCVFMRFMSEFMKRHAADIELGFPKSKYGSSRNAFFSRNQEAFRRAWELPIQNAIEGCEPTIEKLENNIMEFARDNHNVIVLVDRPGYEVVYLDGEWPTEIPLVLTSTEPVFAAVSSDTSIIVTCGQPYRFYGARMQGVRFKVSGLYTPAATDAAPNPQATAKSVYVYADSINYLSLTQATLGNEPGASFDVRVVEAGNKVMWNSANPISTE